MSYDATSYVGPPVGMKPSEEGFFDLQERERLRWETRFKDILGSSPMYGSYAPFVGLGWQPLVWEFLEQAEEICKRHRVQFNVHQIKQKFAGLRLYYGVDYLEEDPDEVSEARYSQYKAAVDACRELSEDYEERASQTCERCGSHENVRIFRTPWMKRYCAACQAEHGET